LIIVNIVSWAISASSGGMLDFNFQGHAAR
jgi:hypothetical protein